jgi:hypothetical protein
MVALVPLAGVADAMVFLIEQMGLPGGFRDCPSGTAWKRLCLAG